MHELDIGPKKSKRRTSEDAAVDAVHNALGRVAYSANFILAVLMVLIGLNYFYSLATEDAQFRISYVIAHSVLVVCGAVIIADKKRSLPRSVGMYAIGMGLYRAFSVMENFRPYSDVNLLYLAIIAVGLNLAFSGRSYLMGESKARIGMMRGAIAMLLIYVVSLIYLFATHDHDLSFLWDHYRRFIIMSLMYIVYIMILDSEKLRRLDWLESHNRVLGGISRTYHLSADAAIEECDAARLAAGMSSEEEWSEVRDGGPARAETAVRIWNGSGATYLIAQKWNGSDSIFLTMSDHEEGTIIQATRLVLDGIEVCGDRLKMAVSDGTVVSIRIVEELRCSGKRTARSTWPPCWAR